MKQVLFIVGAGFFYETRVLYSGWDFFYETSALYSGVRLFL